MVDKARRTAPDGTVFASGGQMRHYCQLKLLEKAGKIRNLRCEVSLPLKLHDGTPIKSGNKIATYRADFTFERLQNDEWCFVIQEYKERDHDRRQRLARSVYEAITKQTIELVGLKR